MEKINSNPIAEGESKGAVIRSSSVKHLHIKKPDYTGPFVAMGVLVLAVSFWAIWDNFFAKRKKSKKKKNNKDEGLWISLPYQPPPPPSRRRR